MARRSRWTYAKTRKLKAMCRDGRLTVTLREAADDLGFSFKAVQVKLHEFGLVAMNAQGFSAKGPRTNNFAWTVANITLLQSISDGGTMRVGNEVAAARLGCSAQTLAKKLNAMGIRPLRPPRFAWTPEREALLQRFCRDGMLTITLMDAARVLRCEEKTVSHKLARMGRQGAGRRVFYGARLRQLQMLIGEDGSLPRTEQEVAAAFGCSWKTVRKAVKAELRRRKRAKKDSR